MTTARRPLLLTTAVLVAAGCARDDAPTSPDLAPVEITADSRAYVVRDLGTLGGHYSFAWGINRHAEVVGSSDGKDGAFRAFLWRRGTMVGLGTLDQGHGWAGSSARRRTSTTEGRSSVDPGCRSSRTIFTLSFGRTA